MGVLEASAGQDTGEASRAGLGTPAAMADPETREAMAGQETREAMAGQETREARRPRWSRELGWPWRLSHSGPDNCPEHGHYGYQDHRYIAPPKNLFGKYRGSIGHLGAHWRRGLLGALGKRGLLGALGRRRHLRALGWHGH